MKTVKTLCVVFCPVIFSDYSHTHSIILYMYIIFYNYISVLMLTQD